MKLLLVVHQFPPEYSAGTEVLTLETAHELMSLGHDVTVLTARLSERPPSDTSTLQDSDFRESFWEGVPVVEYHHDRARVFGTVMVGEYDNQALGARFHGLLRKLNPSLVHFFHLQRASSSIVDACHQLSIPMVMTVTDFWVICPTNQLMLPDGRFCAGPDASAGNCVKHLAHLSQPKLGGPLVGKLPVFLFRFLISLAGRGWAKHIGIAREIRALSQRKKTLISRVSLLDRILVPTKFMRSTLEHNGYPMERVAFQSFGIRVSGGNAPRRPFPTRPLRVGFIGTLYWHKGAHLLVEAFRRIEKSLQVSLAIFGDLQQFPKYSAHLQHLSEGQDNIEFLGTFNRNCIESVLAAIDVLVVPSLWQENSPLVLLHAQAAGCPIIGSRVPGITEVIENGRNGLLFAPGDVAGLATALSRLAIDRVFLERLALNAVCVKGIEAYALELQAVYREVLDERAA